MNLSDSIRYIGASDYSIDLFENQYPVKNGMAYNSYVILDDKIAILDTADKSVGDQWFENLQNVLNGKIPDYLVVQHLEPDHSANICRIVNQYPNIKIVISVLGNKMLPQFCDVNSDNIIVVKEGDTLNLGSHTLTFVMASMVHWPEVMVTYESSEKVLFSADGFGKFGAFDFDENWTDEARRYYFNICGKYGVQVGKLLDKAKALDINTICPLHGPVICGDDMSKVVDLYSTWSSYKAENNGVFIAFASMHGNTKNAALKLKEHLENDGVNGIDICDLSRDDVSLCVSNAFKNSITVCVAPSYDGGVFAPMSDFIHHLSSKGFKNRKVALVENFSWAATANRTMEKEFDNMKDITILNNKVSVKTKLTEETEQKLVELVKEIKENL